VTLSLPEISENFGDTWLPYRELLDNTGAAAEADTESNNINASISQLRQASPFPTLRNAVFRKTESVRGVRDTLNADPTAADIESRLRQVQATVVGIAPQTLQTPATGSDQASAAAEVPETRQEESSA